MLSETRIGILMNTQPVVNMNGGIFMTQLIDLYQFHPETHIWVFTCKRCDVSVKIPKGLLPRFMSYNLRCMECGDAIEFEKKEINYERIENEQNNKEAKS